ncbi:hypothetical protein [Pseudomonas putida]
MATNQYVAAILFVLVSLTGYLACRAIGDFFSGPKLTMKAFILCFAVMLVWGASQLKISNTGTPLFFNAPWECLQSNELIKWIAFISIFFQGSCLPGTEKRRLFRFKR